ncbi:MAG TPA: amidohydrolase family protein [Woeseiaceae bacterium]|nr:amidohydrolase family protein [Woeseiaceae bacterium]
MRARRSRSGVPAALLLPLLFAGTFTSAQVILSEGTNLSVDVSPTTGQLAIDLLGSIWVLDAEGGAAAAVSDNLQPARRPQWSPDGERLLYQTTSAFGSRIWLLDLARNATSPLGDGRHYDQHPDWHPDGRRIVFSSDRRDSGFDIWELDLATDLAWRLTHAPGDETEPAWSPDGRDLAWISRRDGKWRLVLRRRGEPAVDLVVSDTPLAAPSWRPDGTLLTFLRRDGGEYRLDMVILSDPPVVHPLAAHQDFFLSPASWLDRQHLYYAADGVIRRRSINAWQAEEIPFRADAGLLAPRQAGAAARELPVTDAPKRRLVIRAARLFDGMRAGYRQDMDILIEGARIAAVEPRREWEEATVLDLGDVAVLPGFIDVYSALPAAGQAAAGLQLLSFGVTTVVAAGPDRGFDAALWESDRMPGPRLLRAAPASLRPVEESGARPWLVTLPAADGAADGDRALVQAWRDLGVPVLAESWSTGFRLGADLFLGADTLPASPQGFQYQDVRVALGAGPAAMVSGLADAGTPGLSALFEVRQAEGLQRPADIPRRHAALPRLGGGTSSIAVGSKPNGLPAGLATHAELRALAAAGLNGDQVLWAAGRNAARALGLENQVGRIAPGALADLVLVAGDPRARVADAVNVVAVVRNGRFYSVGGLLDRRATVE